MEHKTEASGRDFDSRAKGPGWLGRAETGSRISRRKDCRVHEKKKKQKKWHWQTRDCLAYEASRKAAKFWLTPPGLLSDGTLGSLGFVEALSCPSSLRRCEQQHCAGVGWTAAPRTPARRTRCVRKVAGSSSGSRGRPKISTSLPRQTTPAVSPTSPSPARSNRSLLRASSSRRQPLL